MYEDHTIARDEALAIVTENTKYNFMSIVSSLLYLISFSFEALLRGDSIDSYLLHFDHIKHKLIT